MSANSTRGSADRHVAIDMRRPGEKRSSSRTATRALDVMELFGNVRQALRAIEIGQALGLNPSTANQLLKTMVESGHLIFDARLKTYLPSFRFTGFGGWICTLYEGHGDLRKLMQRLHDELEIETSISTPNDLFMQLVDCIPPTRLAERGLRISLFGSAHGNAYLSTLELVQIKRLAYRARITGPQLNGLLGDIAKIREQGLAVHRSQKHDIVSVAMPLPTHGHHIPYVLSVSGAPADLKSSIESIGCTVRKIVLENLKLGRDSS